MCQAYTTCYASLQTILFRMKSRGGIMSFVGPQAPRIRSPLHVQSLS